MLWTTEWITNHLVFRICKNPNLYLSNGILPHRLHILKCHLLNMVCADHDSRKATLLTPKTLAALVTGRTDLTIGVFYVSSPFPFGTCEFHWEETTINPKADKAYCGPQLSTMPPAPAARTATKFHREARDVRRVDTRQSHLSQVLRGYVYVRTMSNS